MLLKSFEYRAISYFVQSFGFVSSINGPYKKPHHHSTYDTETDNKQDHRHGFYEKHTGDSDHHPHGANGLYLGPAGHAFLFAEVKNIWPKVFI
jgi:hypothetical protein